MQKPRSQIIIHILGVNVKELPLVLYVGATSVTLQHLPWAGVCDTGANTSSEVQRTSELKCDWLGGILTTDELQKWNNDELRIFGSGFSPHLNSIHLLDDTDRISHLLFEAALNRVSKPCRNISQDKTKLTNRDMMWSPKYNICYGAAECRKEAIGIWQR